ncbi:ABC transporter permease [Paenibacillus donghaensis]|nr:ABC transporter permease [Paenibacillus donghaensis]
MIDAYYLFLRRLKSGWAFQYRVIRTVVDDWRVLAYLIIPALLYLIRYYMYLWSSKPEWIYNIQIQHFALFFFAVIGFSTFRYFFDYADQLFLLQRKSWIMKIRKYGMIYAILIHIVKVFVLLLIWLPVIYYGVGMSTAQIALFPLYTAFFTLPILLLKKRIGIKNNLLQRIGLSTLLYVAGGCIYVAITILQNLTVTGVSIIVLGIINIWLIYREPKNYKAHFVEDIQYDIKDRFKVLALLLNNTGHKVRTVRSVRSRPILFKNSKELFKVRSSSNILAESCFKAFYRDSKYNKRYLQFILISCYGIFNLPNLVGSIFLLALGLIHFSLSKMIWFQFLTSDFLNLYSWPADTQKEAGNKTMLMLTVPGYLMISIVFLIASHSFLDVVIRLIVSILIFYICILIKYKKNYKFNQLMIGLYKKMLS